MYIRTEELKNCCSKIILAIDSSVASNISDVLSLKAENKKLYMSVTNREYFVRVTLDLLDDIKFNATVNANLFLKLVNNTSVEVIEFNVIDNYLEMKGNGEYKLPMIFDDDKIMKVPEIKINNPTSNFKIKCEVLDSIAKYNINELNKKILGYRQPSQTMCYVDNEGAITFTSSACVNNFKLDAPVKLMIPPKIIKLFKLFSNDVDFTLGHDAISDTIIQTKIKFESDDTLLCSVISCDDTIVESVPVSIIRNRANEDYSYSVVLDRDELVGALNRLSLFDTLLNSTNRDTIYYKFVFSKDGVRIFDSKENNEWIYYNNETTNITEDYIAHFDYKDLKDVLLSCPEKYLTFKFGNNVAVTISYKNIISVIPELVGE